MEIARDNGPSSGLAGVSPVRLLLIGMFLGWLLARTFDPQPVRVVRFWDVSTPPDPGAH